MRKFYFSLLALFVSMCSFAQITLPLNFEGAGPYTWTNFDGGNTTVISNPQSGGINTSTNVGQTIKGPGGQPWGGSWIQLAGPIDFTTLKFFRMKVFSTAPGKKVLLKVENETNGGQALEVNATTTKTNEWEDLSFNFSAINMAFTYHKIVVIFELGTIGDGSANFTFLFDDIRQEAAPSGALTPPKMPVTFDEPGVDKAFVNFDGGATAVILNPYKSGINTTDTVARMVKNAGAVWAGSKIILGEALNFTTTKLFKMKVYSPRIGAKMLLKVEGSVPTFEKEAITTKANEWEELTFDYTGVSTSLSYNQLVFILDLGTAGDGSPNFTILFDDIRLEAASGGGLTQMNVPVTFDDPSVNYGLAGFGGADASTIEIDPTNSANKVAKVIKSATAEVWAGTTITAVGGGGFATKVPFAPGSTFMNVRVWSPDAGIKVRLKVEDSGDNTKSVETDATTTVAGGWQNLVFDFSQPTTPPTAPINFAYNYNKASIFFNFGVAGATAGEKTYYFDDVVFGANPLPVKFISFTAVKKDKSVVLNWQTATETNNRGFAVERSRDGQTWSEFNFVKATAPNGAGSQYATSDVTPAKGINYYRLKQIDLDGKETYSAIKVVNFNANGATVSIYPNPTRGKVNVNVSDVTGKIMYSIVQLNGKTVLSGSFSSGSNVNSIDVSHLPAGTYLINITGDQFSKSEKLMLQ